MILLYNPQSSAARKPVLPMSLLAVGALLEGRHDYRIVDGNLEADPLDRLDGLIRETRATVLGVTVMPGPQLAQAVPLTKALKERHPHLTVVWGGYFPTQHAEVCLRSPYVDYAVRGYGEVVFAGLVDALARGESPMHNTTSAEHGGRGTEPSQCLGSSPVHHASCSVPRAPAGESAAGLAFRSAAGTIAQHPLAPIPHPEHLPDLPYHRVDVDRYVRRSFLGRRTLPHHSSYGCPFSCNFCGVVTMASGRWLAQSAERTAAAVAELHRRWRIDAVELYDNNFFVHEARAVEFAERIRPLGLGWWGEGRIDTLLKYHDATWRAMRESGLKMVFMGAESGSDETLQRMDKGGTMATAKTLEIVALMRRWRIVPELSFVVGNPPDPAADIARTMEFVRRVKQVNPAAEIILYLYTPVPLGGDLYDTARAAGFQFPETLEEWVSPAWQEFALRRGRAMPWLRDRLRRQLHDFERVLNAYYPTTTDARLTGLSRALLRAAGSWRYRTGFYSFPIELRLLQRLFAYQRPETTGF